MDHRFYIGPPSDYSTGEQKIVFDCLREMGKLSAAERQTLPHSLRERFSFYTVKPEDTKTTQNPSKDYREKPSAHHTGRHENQAHELDLYGKCIDLWPTYEALYWGIQHSGLDLEEFEKLECKIQAAHQQKKMSPQGPPAQDSRPTITRHKASIGN